jgi:hypothetical protein
MRGKELAQGERNILVEDDSHEPSPEISLRNSTASSLRTEGKNSRNVSNVNPSFR